MKKFLVFFVMLFGLACSAMAVDPDDRHKFIGSDTDTKTRESYSCAQVPSTDSQDEQIFAVYFNTADSEPSETCKAYFEKVKNKLNALKDKVAYFIIVGSADKQGENNSSFGSAGNRNLSIYRYNYVVDSILPSEAEAHDKGWVAGSNTDLAFNPDSGSGWQYRSVYIYPVWKQAKLFACDNNLRNSISSKLNELNLVKGEYEHEASIIDPVIGHYQEALTLCGSAGTKLDAETWSEIAKNLTDAVVLIETIQKDHPEINIGIPVKPSDIYNIVDIDAVFAKLISLRDSFGVSVWKNAEGKFNTARLASDSVAAVVLGTVGGIVTSKLVKKNQLKKGFEDLSCHVGGQRVADYGDSFRMGLQ